MFINKIMRKFLLIIGLLIAINSLANTAPSKAEAALISFAGLGPDARVNFAETDGKAFVLGVVVGQEQGKLILLRENSGQYQIVAASAAFEHNFGPRYYIEIVQASGPHRFSIQVNAHTACGVIVEIFRFAQIAGNWRVSGYDRSEPDMLNCDPNYLSHKYSVNFLSRKVNVVEYKNGKALKQSSRPTKLAAPDLEKFNFEVFQREF